MGDNNLHIDRVADMLSKAHTTIISGDDHLIIGETSLSPREVKYLVDRLLDIMEGRQEDLLDIYSSIRGNLRDKYTWKVVDSKIAKNYAKLIDQVISKTAGNKKKKYLRERANMLLENSSVEEGLSTTSEGGSTPLHLAAFAGDPSLVAQVKEVFKSRMSDVIDQPNKSGYTPLVLAVFYNNFDLAEMLIDERANIDATTPDMKTALHLMIMTKKLEGVRFCLDHGSKILQKDGTGRSELHFAAMCDDVEILRLLLTRSEYQDHLEDRDLFGRTPLDLAYEEKNDEVIELLGGDLNSPLYGQRQVVVKQGAVIEKFQKYLSLKGREDFVGNEGDCNGFSFLFQYYCRKGRSDEFFQILELIASWDGSEEGLLNEALVEGFSGNYKNLEEVIEQWVNDVLYFQHSMGIFGGGLRQSDRLQQFEFVKKDEQSRIDLISQWDNLYTRDQVTEVLRFYSYFPNLTVEISIKRHRVVCCMLPDGKMRFYDPNIEYQLEPFESVERISTVLQNLTYPMLSNERWDSIGVGFLAYYLHGNSLDDSATTAPIQVPKEMVGSSSPNGWTQLHLAVLFNDDKLFTEQLSDKKLDIQARDAHKYTPLRFAIDLERTDMVMRLLDDPRVDVNYDSHGENLLSCAVKGGNRAIVDMLMSCDGVGSLVDGALTVALNNEDIAILQVILESGHEINLDTIRMLSLIESPLEYALAKRNLEMIKLLLQHGADPRHRFIGDDTPLSMIADIRDENMLQEIIPLLGDLQKKDKSGKVLAEYAKEKDNTELQKLL